MGPDRTAAQPQERAGRGWLVRGLLVALGWYVLALGWYAYDDITAGHDDGCFSICFFPDRRLMWQLVFGATVLVLAVAVVPLLLAALRLLHHWLRSSVVAGTVAALMGFAPLLFGVITVVMVIYLLDRGGVIHMS